MLTSFIVGLLSSFIYAKDCPPLNQVIHTFKSPNYHTLFVRCHPTKPIVFSNEMNENGDAYPVMIDLRTGKVTPFPMPKELRRGRTPRRIEINTSGLDPSPSPSGRFVYANLFQDGKSYLGVFKVNDSKKIKRVGMIQGSYISYDYPSAAVRDGKEKVLYRHSKGLFLDNISSDGKKTTPGQMLCPQFISSGSLDRPYISHDASFVGTAYKGNMSILKLKWDQATAKEVPCEVVRQLPANSGKLSFSRDGRKVAFHSDEIDHLGKVAKGTSGSNSFVMDIESGDIAPLTNIKENEHSEFPDFCGNNGIITRTTDEDTMSNATFKLIKIPSTDEIRNYARNCGKKGDTEADAESAQ